MTIIITKPATSPAPTNNVARLLTTRHPFTIAQGEKPRFYELTAPFLPVSFELTASRQFKFVQLPRERNAPIYNHLTPDAPLISQHRKTLTYAETVAAVNAQQITGDIRTLSKALEIFAPFAALIPAAKAYKTAPHTTPFLSFAEAIINATNATAYNDGKLTGNHENHTLELTTILKSVNFNTHKNGAFLEALNVAILNTLKNRYTLETAEDGDHAARIYGNGYYRNPYSTTSCHDLSSASPRTYREQENIKDALTALISEPAPGIAPSFEVCALFDSKNGTYVARWIQRARGEKRGNTARVYHAFQNDTEASRILKMYGVKITSRAYHGGIFKLTTNVHNAILCLYSDDKESRENIRLKRTSTGVDVLQYGGEKGDRIGKADNTNGTLSTFYGSGYNNEAEYDDDDHFRCNNCGDMTDSDECRSDDNGNDYCEYCYNELFTYCEDCNNMHEADDVDSYEVATGTSANETEYRNICCNCISDYFKPPHSNSSIIYHFDFIKDNLM